jgi:Flp pilus assembly pilin Flp
MTFVLINLWRDQRGQDFMEYALIAGLLTAVCVGIAPGMFSIATHVNEVLLAVTQAAAEVATLK